MRSAFTLVELLVAIVVFTIGLLALAATAGLVAARVGDGARLSASAHLARSIMDSLATRPCDAIAGGVTALAGSSATWSVTRDSASTTVALTLGSALRRRNRQDAYRLVVPCVRP